MQFHCQICQCFFSYCERERSYGYENSRIAGVRFKTICLSYEVLVVIHFWGLFVFYFSLLAFVRSTKLVYKILQLPWTFPGCILCTCEC